MKKITWLVLLLLLATVLGCFAGCGGKNGDETVTTDSAATTENAATTGDGAETDEPGWISALPVRDFAGRDYRVLGRDGGSATPQFTNFEIYAEADGSLMHDAVYARNEAVFDKYHVFVKLKLSANVVNDAELYYMGGEGADEGYDLVIYRISEIQPHATTGFLADLNNVPWIDFTAPTWNTNANEQLSLMNKLYYSTSDYLLVDKNRTYLNIYNRELARANQLGALEDLVDSGEWTYDKFFEIQTAVSVEIDGTPGHSKDDAFGLVMDSYNAFVPFVYGGGFRLSNKTDDDKLTLTGNTASALDAVEQAIKITCDMEKAMYCNDYANDWSIANNTFYETRALISTTFLSVFDTSMSERCSFEYGFLPFPKMNEEQKIYYTVPDTSHSQLFAIPDKGDKDFAGYMLELFSEVSTNTTKEVFYETKCKLRQSYDAECARMLDLIFEHVVYDNVLVGDYGSLRGLLNSEMPSKKMSGIYSAMYKTRSKAAQGELTKLFEEYEKRL